MTEQTSTFDVTEFKNPDETKKEETTDIVEKVPERVFIVPYRDREPHKMVFSRVMPYILGDSNYRILFIHQNFPGQFKMLAPELALNSKYDIASG